MPELILPGVYIEERAEALIVSGPISIGNIGIVGTATQGPVNQIQVLGSYNDATQLFGPYDPLKTPRTTNHPLTLVRALEQAYNNGASTVLAVRIASATAHSASHDVAGQTATAATLTASSPGAWGNGIKIKIDPADPNNPNGPKVTVTLTYAPAGAPEIQEAYTVATGDELVTQVNAGSALVTAAAGTGHTEKPKTLAEANFANGVDGADANDATYAAGLDLLLNENAQIIVAAGRGRNAATNSQIPAALLANVQNASSDEVKRERIAVYGLETPATSSTLAQIVPGVESGRMIFVAPGIQATDAATPNGDVVTLPSSYTAAAIAGMIAARDPQVSLTNQEIAVGGLETRFTAAQLTQLIETNVLALEERVTDRVVKGITTDNGAFRQITTRRIVDYARFGVRANAEPYIGLLNNDRVRKALKGSINGFLAGMVDDEQLESYDLDVTATRDQEIRGIAQVTMTLQPVFSIDYIKVVMYLG